MKLYITLILASFALHVHAQVSVDYKKLETACDLWGIVKFFHPRGQSPRVDSAFAAQMNNVTNLRNEADWRYAHKQWLSVLGDQGIEVVKKNRKLKNVLRKEFTKDSVLVVTVQGADIMNDFVGMQKFFLSMLEDAKRSKGVIMDLRQEDFLPADFIGSYNSMFDYLKVNNFFATECIPQQRTREHHGYAGETKSGSGGYYSASKLRPAFNVQKLPPTDVQVVWVVNRYTELPGVALSGQCKGQSIIISDSEDITSLAAEVVMVPLDEQYEVRITISEVVLPDNVVPAVNTVYKPGENPIQLALQKLTSSKKPIINRTQLRPIDPGRVSAILDHTPYPSVGLRVLAAAKIYNVIHYFFPYHEYLDNPWRESFSIYLPSIVGAKDAMQYHEAIAKLYTRIQDSHGYITGNIYLDQVYDNSPSPVSIDLLENKIVVTRLRNDSICKVLDIRRGDIITHVNDVPVEALMKQFADAVSHSTPQSIDEQAAREIIRGKEGTSATFTLQGGNKKTRNVQVTFTNAHNKKFKVQYTYDTLQLITPEIGYADLTRMQGAQVDRMFELFKQTKAIIFDMRGYPYGTIWTIGPRLTEKQNVAVALFKCNVATSPAVRSGEILESKTVAQFIQTVSNTDKWIYKGKTVMLMDHNAVSQSEHSALFVKALNNTTIIGSPSAGANGDVTNFVIPGGMTLNFSGQGVWYPDGRQLQRKGIQPDIVVYPSIRGVISNKDEVAEKAIEWIQKTVKKEETK